VKRWVLTVATLGACGITETFLASEASPLAGGHPAVKTKVLHFPKDQSLGYLNIEPDLAKLDLTRLELRPMDRRTGLGPTEFVAEAQGDVVVPADRKVGLGTRDASEIDLSCLLRLEPNDLYSFSTFFRTRKGRADERILVPLPHLSGLQVLSVDGTGMTSQGMRYINELHSLRALCLGESWVGDSGLALLQDMPALEYFCATGVTDAGLKYLARFTSLKWLRLRVPGNIRGPGLADLAYIPRLERLCLEGETGLTDQHIQYLQGLDASEGPDPLG